MAVNPRALGKVGDFIGWTLPWPGVYVHWDI